MLILVHVEREFTHELVPKEFDVFPIKGRHGPTLWRNWFYIYIEGMNLDITSPALSFHPFFSSCWLILLASKGHVSYIHQS
jgi:hypothetical protein